jgi:hypothetical protein
VNLDRIALLRADRDVLAEELERSIMEAMNAPDRNVSRIAGAAGMTRAGVHKLVKRRKGKAA